MDVEFEFKEKNGGACVTKLLAPGAVCVVPESLGGLPVTELADKVFSGSMVEKVYLPRTLTRIGRYEFYGCEKLQEIHFYGALREVGGGEAHNVEIRVTAGEMDEVLIVRSEGHDIVGQPS